MAVPWFRRAGRKKDDDVTNTNNTWVIVGLGNPGLKYVGNRHNVGHMVVDELAGRVGARFRRHRANASVAEQHLTPGGFPIIVVKPHSFMNHSGGSVASVLKFYSQSSEQMIVIHDDLDLTFGSLKVKNGGGHGGHNGLRDIISALGTGDFIRIRVGIGRPPGHQSAADYVLHDFSSEERELLPHIVTDAADAVEVVVVEGLVVAQQRFHSPQ
jgi:PTH1 family peptidyl-tRNA hydrolase